MVDLGSGAVFIADYDTNWNDAFRGLSLGEMRRRIAWECCCEGADILSFLGVWLDELKEAEMLEQEFLIRAAEDPNACDEEDFTHLRRFVAAGDLAGVQEQVAYGASVERLSQGLTAAGMACVYGKPEILEWLLERGASVEGTGADGVTPLMEAARHSNIDCVRILLGAGANKDAEDSNGRIAFDHIFQLHATDELIALLKTERTDKPARKGRRRRPS